MEKSEDGEPDVKVLREFLRDVVAVRRGDQSGARLKLEQERLEREREKTEEEIVAHFQHWVKTPAVRDLICRAWISPEEREARLREIFGRPPKPPEAAATDGPENPAEDDAAAKTAGAASGPVKPDQTK